MNKQEIIKRLTDLLATISGYYFKGRLEGCRPQVHEHSDSGVSISIDLYNFGGDGEPVCDGLKPCTITYDDGTQDSGHLFCMIYDPDDVTPLVFLFSPEDESDDIEIDPEDMSEEVLQNILTWLEAEWESNAMQEGKPDVKQLTAMMDRWAGFCCNHPPYDEVILWMVGGSKKHYLYQHFWAKGLHLCEDICHDDTMATWVRFYRELDDQYAERLMKYVFCEWKKNK